MNVRPKLMRLGGILLHLPEKSSTNTCLVHLITWKSALQLDLCHVILIQILL